MAGEGAILIFLPGLIGSLLTVLGPVGLRLIGLGPVGLGPVGLGIKRLGLKRFQRCGFRHS